jgi:hypothetical protein
MRLRHFSPRTEDAYIGWMRRRDPAELGGEHAALFLSALATRGRVSASTQNQAPAALLFLYRDVLGRELPWMTDIVRAKTPSGSRWCSRARRCAPSSPTWRACRA